MAARAYWSARPSIGLAHELFGGRVGHGADGHVGRGDAAGVIEWSGDAEVGEEHTGVIGIEVGDDDVGGLDVAVQQTFLVGVVQRTGDGGSDGYDVADWHARWVAQFEQVS